MDRNQAHKLVDQIYDSLGGEVPAAELPPAEEKPARTDGKRVIRTKSTGDNVYLLDPNASPQPTKQWVTTPEVLESLGFTMANVEEIEDSEALSYRMAPSIYKPVE